MSIFTPDDYKREAIKLGYLDNKYMKKVKLPTQTKSKSKWCRNCARQKKISALYCDCGKSSWSLRKIL